MTEAELEEIAARADAATPGPWVIPQTTYEHACGEWGDQAHRPSHIAKGQCADCVKGYPLLKKELRPGYLLTQHHVHLAPLDVLDIRSGDRYVVGSANETGEDCEQSSAGVFDLEDAQFIAAARQDVPRLVAEVRRLQEEISGIEHCPGCDSPHLSNNPRNR